MAKGSWGGATGDAMTWNCGFCGERVSATLAFQTSDKDPGQRYKIRICPHCDRPSFFDGERHRVPTARFGDSVDGLPSDVATLYDEARRAVGVGAHTAAVLCCRKILMHVATEKGAPEGKSFLSYVEHLDDGHHIPTGAKAWVDYIRKKGNEANHEIVMMTKADAEGLVFFVQTLLRNVYELPSKVPQG